jgi:hypothetical protein
MAENASELVWSAPRQVLFSEIKTGLHMRIMTAGVSRIGKRQVYPLRKK